MLSVSQLSIDYGSNRVVSDLNISLGENEILMLVGPTGCGKSTILQALAGLIPISEGEINVGKWRATPKRNVPPEKRSVGMVFQDFALFPHLTVEQNICFRLKDTAIADHWIKLLGLNDFRAKKPATLSGGQKQRVALARTLAHQPDFVLLDEPLSNLDAALKDMLRWDIRNALKEAGVPAVWVTHDQEEALSVGDRVGVLQNGKIQQLDSPEQCFSMPNNRFVARFLGEASFIAGQFENGQATTSIGVAPGQGIDCDSGDVDVLLRPDDVQLIQNLNQPNGEVVWVRFEGGSRLCAVKLSCNKLVTSRVSHEVVVNPGDSVHVSIVTTHPLAVYKKQ
ncbi:MULTISPECIES: ABC transporter ATP-binding protein [unclassified Pseudoalteromonas]|uniref:ABC transporter ATP-binding protein n=1 Tax=unclassified Pseudoalteromonas TaxID=194690 RepID=UPI000B7161B1|nr:MULTISPECIES: ABC transporter ATP-binding protein [unclassified Pseudoalteromonas]MAJ38732.1 ABC transporter ATP-binding protein [Pseudoalteromonadaceae bacterium]OUX93484.1 MAG: ABC transporter ATP-binding protein [Pseudoalteromonas sp. TMED43]MDC9566090.1 ABC transporter ATP-binding protein [Pseudoalteromonas sp. GAB2316C]MDC9567583.1 ABC transporter ATP-binding protein [Pseudoalteromonas sp. GABNB9D]MDC9571719.1 ABC transporter ATP-binding protein [Pseudoalteromonas sp. GABNS16A]|tara:strand:+ start:1227 stop:2240 length:1014 start_codon:yes stop_codon:yes gene_type:complete